MPDTQTSTETPNVQLVALVGFSVDEHEKHPAVRYEVDDVVQSGCPCHLSAWIKEGLVGRKLASAIETKSGGPAVKS